MKVSLGLVAVALAVTAHAKFDDHERYHGLGRRATTTSSSPAAQCTAGSQTINGRTCTIGCQTDRAGGDYRQLHAGTFAACMQACATDSQCITAQFNEGNGYCYLKNTLNNKSYNPNVDTVDCAAVCTAGTRTINGRQCTISCGADRPGGDYALQQTASFDACVQACAADSKCTTAQYNLGNAFCYFKNTRNPVVANSGVETVDCNPAPAVDGASCQVNGDCASHYCNAGNSTSGKYCGYGPVGAGCMYDQQCLYGYCNPSQQVCGYQTHPDGFICSKNESCDSGYCNSIGRCGKVPNGQSCGADNDCTGGICNSYYKICGLDYSGCFRNQECSSNICTLENRCGPIADGQRCYRSSDCTSKYCNLGDGTYGQSYCGLGSNGMGCTSNAQCKSSYCNLGIRSCTDASSA